MIILTLRTDKPEAEIGLFDDTKQLAFITWPAHRQLAETLHIQIQELLAQVEKELHDIRGLIVYAGPGSFTGLRIGISVANALAYSLNIPITGGTTDGWIEQGYRLLVQANEQPTTQVVPIYGAPINITAPRK